MFPISTRICIRIDNQIYVTIYTYCECYFKSITFCLCYRVNRQISKSFYGFLLFSCYLSVISFYSFSVISNGSLMNKNKLNFLYIPFYLFIDIQKNIHKMCLKIWCINNNFYKAVYNTNLLELLIFFFMLRFRNFDH